MGKDANGTAGASPDVRVIDEGLDEAGRRYFLLGVEGKPIPNLQPMLASRFSEDQKGVASARERRV